MHYIIIPDDIPATDDLTGEPMYELDSSRTCTECGKPKPERTTTRILWRFPAFLRALLRDKKFGESEEAIDAWADIRTALDKLEEESRMPLAIPPASKWHPYRGLRVLAIEGASYKLLEDVVKKPTGGYNPSAVGPQRPFLKAIRAAKEQEKDPRELARAEASNGVEAATAASA